MGSDLGYIDKIVQTEIMDFSAHFLKDYCGDKGKKRDNIPNKKHNIFIAALGNDVTIYSALMRSLDSSLGNRIEKIAKLIAEQNYLVKNKIEGYISKDSIETIADLLDKYENHGKKPEDEDIETVYREATNKKEFKGHKSDYYLILKSDPSKKFLIELKIGGDLDNKKAKSEKEALLKQYVILRNSEEIKPQDTVKILFCTAYNKNGESEEWIQERVKQFFSPNEIKIGRDFWNFISCSLGGYDTVKNSYLKHAHYLRDTLVKIVGHYS